MSWCSDDAFVLFNAPLELFKMPLGSERFSSSKAPLPGHGPIFKRGQKVSPYPNITLLSVQHLLHSNLHRANLLDVNRNRGVCRETSRRERDLGLSSQRNKQGVPMRGTTAADLHGIGKGRVSPATNRISSGPDACPN